MHMHNLQADSIVSTSMPMPLPHSSAAVPADAELVWTEAVTWQGQSAAAVLLCPDKFLVYSSLTEAAGQLVSVQL